MNVLVGTTRGWTRREKRGRTRSWRRGEYAQKCSAPSCYRCYDDSSWTTLATIVSHGRQHTAGRSDEEEVFSLSVTPRMDVKQEMDAEQPVGRRFRPTRYPCAAPFRYDIYEPNCWTRCAAKTPLTGARRSRRKCVGLNSAHTRRRNSASETVSVNCSISCHCRSVN
jgi:hypothetical protein